MKHGLKQRKLNRTSSHRLALLKNLSISLIKHETITTTTEKAKELRKKWSDCVSEFGKMISQEVKTNPRYKRLNLK